MTYAEQLEIIKGIPIREGDTKVIQCPFCGGYKKLAVSKLDGQLKWYCYRASCNGKGIYTGKRNLAAAKNYMANDVATKAIIKRPIPSITTSVENHQPALDYLTSVNSLEAYQAGYVSIRYAPAEDRVLFLSEEGAVGRSLKKYGPKWISYGITTDGLHVGSGDIAVLVEDIPSACSVSRLEGICGVALLGTTVSMQIRKSLGKDNTVYLVLDKDASAKALAQTKYIDKSLKVRLTKKDLKYLTKVSIKDLLTTL